jgi:vitamin B12 transporter
MALEHFPFSVSPLLLMALALGVTPAFAHTDDSQTLRMFYDEKDLAVVTRTVRPASQSAEEMTVITAEEIRMRNVHTLADLIATIPGVQASLAGGPGSSLLSLSLQGVPQSHVLVTMDGITLNNLNDAYPDLAVIPVGIIERVEIITGPASSAWGPSVGGVINVITREPEDEHPVSGTAHASTGTALATDLRGDVTGTVGTLGYYLYGGMFRTGGMTPVEMGVHDAAAYGKFVWQPGVGNRVALTAGYGRSNREPTIEPIVNPLYRDDGRQFMATLAATRDLTDSAGLSLLLRTMHRNTDERLVSAGGPLLADHPVAEEYLGASTTFTWKDELQNLAAGVDYDHGDGSYNSVVLPKRNLDRWGIFASDTITFQDFSVTPGIRYDRVSTSGDYYSPSLGVVWRVTPHTRFRGSVARGYGLPQLVPNLSPGLIFTWQAGFESQDWDPVLFHCHYFYSTVDGIPVSRTLVENRRNRGVEAGFSTEPYFHTSLSANLVYIDSRSDATGNLVPGAPRLTSDIGVTYADGPFKGLLAGHYIQWNDAPGVSAQSTFIWDLNLSGEVYTAGHRRLELFLSLHNLFDGSQYPAELFTNPGRWVEGGVRAVF